MKYQIENDKIKVEIRSWGAEMCSIWKKEKDGGLEYLWQGDEATWPDQALNLFPYIGRMPNKKYQYQNREYTMNIHGFAWESEFECVKIRPDYLMCFIEDTKETRDSYPFAFRFEIHYELMENKIRVYFIVKNKEGKTMYFGVGGHPGFRVPLREQECFEEYYFQFPQDAEPKKVLMTDTGYVLEGTEDFPLEPGNRLTLDHHLFDHDAIVLCEMGSEIQLCGPKGPVVTVRYPQMGYLGLWHWPKAEVSYVCIEPWSSIPSRLEVVEKLEEKQDLLQLEAYGEYSNIWEMEIM